MEFDDSLYFVPANSLASHHCHGLINLVCECVCVFTWLGCKFKAFYSWYSNGPGGTSGVHTTCCEEWLILRVPSLVPGDFLAWLMAWGEGEGGGVAGNFPFQFPIFPETKFSRENPNCTIECCTSAYIFVQWSWIELAIVFHNTLKPLLSGQSGTKGCP